MRLQLSTGMNWHRKHKTWFQYESSVIPTADDVPILKFEQNIFQLTIINNINNSLNTSLISTLINWISILHTKEELFLKNKNGTQTKEQYLFKRIANLPERKAGVLVVVWGWWLIRSTSSLKSPPLAGNRYASERVKMYLFHTILQNKPKEYD